MKKKFFSLSCLLFATGLFVSLAAGAANQKPMEAKADVETYYLVGTFADNYSNYEDAGNWDNKCTKYPVVENDQDPANFSFKAESGDNHSDQFKFVKYNDWGSALGFSSVRGTAKSCFELTGGNDNNISCIRTGDYYVYVSSGYIYIDYVASTEFAYTGSDENKSDDNKTWGAGWSQNRVKADGVPVQYTFANDEEFKFKLPYTWDDQLNYDALHSTDGDYYGYKSFQKNNGEGEDKNIQCLYGTDYNVSITTVDHQLVLNIAPANPNTKTLYVLDLNGDCLNTTHKAHYWNDTLGLSTNWPGTDMEKVEGTNNIYKVEIWGVMTHVIFDSKPSAEATTGNENNPQAIDLNDGKCLMFTWDTNPQNQNKWDNNTWLSLEAGRFIDGYMKFETAKENAGEGSGLCKSKGWYSDAKAAFALLSDGAKSDVHSFKRVNDRLVAWAAANSETFDGSAFTAANTSRVLYTIAPETANNYFIIVLATFVIIGGVAFGVMLKKRKEK